MPRGEAGREKQKSIVKSRQRREGGTWCARGDWTVVAGCVREEWQRVNSIAGIQRKREGIRTGEGNNAMLNRRRRVGEARVLYCIYCRLCIVHVYCYCGIYM